MARNNGSNPARHTPLGASRDTQNRVRVDQVDLTLRLAPFTILTGLSVSTVICLYFWQTALLPYGAVLQSVNLVLAILSLRAAQSWRRSPPLKRAASIQSFSRRMVAVAALAGIMLASIPMVLFASAGPDGRLLIAVTCAGLIATGICIGFVPGVGIAYSGAIITGSFVALAMTGEPFVIVIAILLAIYTFFIFATILQISKQVSLRAIAQIDLDRQREVSDLLLSDFEQNSSDWLWEIDAEGLIRAPSARFAEVAGLAPLSLASLPLAMLLRPHADEAGEASAALFEAIDQHRSFRRLVVPVRIYAENRWWALTGKPVLDSENRFCGFRGVGSDATLETEYVERLNHLANHDTLTGLPNRRRFEELAAEARGQLLTEPQGVGHAVLCLDLDRFKQVNDTFGHVVGDELLRQIARRLSEVVGRGTVVSRFAGDEFAIIQRGVSDARTSACLARRIVERLQEPFTFDGYYLDVGVSIGIALARDGDSSHEALRKADVALYKVKENGGGGYRFYDPAMDQRKEERATLMGELKGALERGEFSLAYQPQVSSDAGTLLGFEALMRWVHPTHGHVPPGEFVALAEETGTILALGEWGLRAACRFASTWPDRSLSIAVNVSTVQIRHCDMVGLVSQVLAECGLEPGRLELEITETAFMTTTSETQLVLARLRELGVRLSLDDFGTGYSSLSYLKKLPIDKIKIDRSFIIDLPGSESDVSIVRTIVELARSLGKTTIAEGVETFAQRDCLRQLGCPAMQGFLFGRGGSEEETLALIARKSRWFEPRVVA